MNKIRELIIVLADKDINSRAKKAKAHNTCKICGKAANSFHNGRAKLEYSISLMCQSCQDYYLPE